VPAAGERREVAIFVRVADVISCGVSPRNLEVGLTPLSAFDYNGTAGSISPTSSGSSTTSSLFLQSNRNPYRFAATITMSAMILCGDCLPSCC
jgi:hypothetical protein